MSTTTTILIFIFISIAFASIIIAGLIKIVFFYKQKDAFLHILKYGLWGQFVGMIILFALWIFYKKEMNNWAEPESIIAIPFFLMLAGELTGLIIIFRNNKNLTP